jgi:glutathione S-transferase
VTDALAAIRKEKAFLKLSPAARDRVLHALFETQRHIEGMKQQERYDDRALRLRNRNALKSHLSTVLKLFGDPVCAVDATDWLVGHHRGYLDAASSELWAFRVTAQRLLDGAKAFEPWPSRSGRAELPFRAELTQQAFCELTEVFESVGVPVRASLGARTVLLTRLIAYAVGFEVSVHTVKAIVLHRNQK